MFLHEEYCKRHGLTVPIVMHTQRGRFLLKNPKKVPRYVVFSIDWLPGKIRPGYYAVNYFTPLHNGYVQNRFFSRMEKEKILQWDEYQDYMLELAQEIAMRPIIGLTESFFACWEIFVYCYDSWLAGIASPQFRNLVDGVINEDLPIADRADMYKAAVGKLNDSYPEVAMSFGQDILGFVDAANANWFAKLVNFYSVV